MEPLAHASIGLMAKPLAPKAPLWALLVATAVPDILFFGFQAAGLENNPNPPLDLAHGIQYSSLPSIPWSHGLSMCLLWSVAVTAIAFLFCHDRRTSIVVGSMVFSHWVLDFIVYPIMPVFFDNSHMIGLGLMTSGPGFIASIVLEVSLIIGGITTYWVTRKQITQKAHEG